MRKSYYRITFVEFRNDEKSDMLGHSTVAGCSGELEDLRDWAWLAKTCDDFDDVPEAVRKAG